MGRAAASIEVPGLASEAEELWYDPVRWASWIDGFGHVVELSDGWPAEGRLQWNSTPGGRGRVLVRSSGTEPLLRIMIEGEDQATVQAWAEEIAEAVRTALG